VERELPERVRQERLGSISYLGNKTNHVWVGEEINPAVFGPGANKRATRTNGGVLYLQNPTVGSGYARHCSSEQGGNSRYAGMLVRYNIAWRATSRSCGTTPTRTASVTRTSVGELAGNYYSNPANRSQDKGDCNFDVRHLMNTSLIAQKPIQGTQSRGQGPRRMAAFADRDGRQRHCDQHHLGYGRFADRHRADRPNQILADCLSP